MSFHDLTMRERHHLQRAYSQAVYYAHRGLYDAIRIHMPDLPPRERSRITGIVSNFLNSYVIPELGYLVAGGEEELSDGLTRITLPKELQP
jgi:hypothetical protein